jgi:hypothetical protein
VFHFIRTRNERTDNEGRECCLPVRCALEWLVESMDDDPGAQLSDLTGRAPGLARYAVLI